jgi:hypothetical protein
MSPFRRRHHKQVESVADPPVIDVPGCLGPLIHSLIPGDSYSPPKTHCLTGDYSSALAWRHNAHHRSLRWNPHVDGRAAGRMEAIADEEPEFDASGRQGHRVQTSLGCL